MPMERKPERPARVIVVGNEKGGSGKSTVAMRIAVALVKARQTVATVDLDARQKSLTHYVENRRAWAGRVGRDLDAPLHLCPDVAAGSDAKSCRWAIVCDGSSGKWMNAACVFSFRRSAR